LLAYQSLIHYKPLFIRVVAYILTTTAGTIVVRPSDSYINWSVGQCNYRYVLYW
jgi:hypothetical protein